MTDDLPDPPTKEEVEKIRAEVESEQEGWDPLDLPQSQEQLIRDIRDAGGPDDLISRAGAGLYHDYASPHPMPKHLLVADARAAGLEEIAQRAMNGHYDP